MTRAERIEARKTLREKLQEKSRAKNTKRAYDNAWNQWKCWCTAEGVEPLNPVYLDHDPHDPADLPLVDYIAHMHKEGKARSTIRNARFGIRWHLREAGVEDHTAHPEVQKVLAGVVRDTPKLSPNVGKARGLRLPDLAQVRAWNPRFKSPAHRRRVLRGKLSIEIMYAALLRVSEAAGLRYEHVKWPTDTGPTGRAKIFLSRSKGDQTGEGCWRTLSAAATRALREWAGENGRIVREGLDDQWIDTGARAGDPGFEPRYGPVFEGGNGRGASDKSVVPDTVAQDIRLVAGGAGLAPGIRSHSPRVGRTLDLYLIHEMPLEHIRISGRWRTLSMVREYLAEWIAEADPGAESLDDPLADL